MMEREWAVILARYGVPVTVVTGASTVAARAFLQPILEKGEGQLVPSPLGSRREERFLYLGEPDVALTAGESLVTWSGQTFDVWSARCVTMGGAPSHWWAVLRPQEKEAST